MHGKMGGCIGGIINFSRMLASSSNRKKITGKFIRSCHDSARYSPPFKCIIGIGPSFLKGQGRTSLGASCKRCTFAPTTSFDFGCQAIITFAEGRLHPAAPLYSVVACGFSSPAALDTRRRCRDARVRTRCNLDKVTYLRREVPRRKYAPGKFSFPSRRAGGGPGLGAPRNVV